MNWNLIGWRITGVERKLRHLMLLSNSCYLFVGQPSRQGLLLNQDQDSQN